MEPMFPNKRGLLLQLEDLDVTTSWRRWRRSDTIKVENVLKPKEMTFFLDEFTNDADKVALFQAYFF